MRLPFYWRLFHLFILTCLNCSLNYSFKAQIATAENKSNRAKNLACPQNIEDLATLLTRDISEYGNRVIQKTRIHSRKLDFFSTYIVTAGKPEIEPISFKPFQSSNDNLPDDVQQIFFTSLERQYSKRQTIIETQNYHWLILTQTSDGWTLVMAFTKFGYPHGDKFVISPRRDTTNGIIGQAVKLWLKDCRYGTLRTVQNEP